MRWRTGGPTLDRKVRIQRSVLSREIDGEVVILHLGKGFYYGLDRVGAFIWRRLSRATQLRHIADSLVSAYRVAPARAERDLIRFVRSLAREKLVDIR